MIKTSGNAGSIIHRTFRDTGEITVEGFPALGKGLLIAFILQFIHDRYPIVGNS